MCVSERERTRKRGKKEREIRRAQETKRERNYVWQRERGDSEIREIRRVREKEREYVRKRI